MTRRRHLRLALGLAVCAIAGLSFTGQAAAGVSVSLDKDVAFPERSLLLTLPERGRLEPDQVRVTERGARVDARVAPLGAGRRAKLGVVLAVDASTSMKGSAYDGAIEAARSFSDARNVRQPLAIVTFGTGSRLLLPFTTDEARIEAALNAPGRPKGGTHLYDAALRSIELVRDQELPGGFVVVLSDGTDHGSRSSEKAVIAAARAAKVKLYTVGLRSASFDPDALGRLAEQSGGQYSEATSATELETIYSELGAQLSNVYTVRYRSPMGAGQRVDVRVSVERVGSATTSYRTPSLAAPEPNRSGSWASSTALLLAVGVVVGLLMLAIFLLLRGPRVSARERVSQFVTPANDQPADGATLTGRLADKAERSFSTAGWWEGYATDVDVAGLRYSPGQIFVASIFVVLPLAFLVGSLTGLGLVGVALMVLAPLVIRGVVHWRATKERELFGEQLADHLAVVGGSLRVGHSLPAALAAALDEAADPSRREFERVVTDERLGRPLEDALETTSVRMRNREVEHVALLARLQREAGADAAEMVDQVVATVRERQELRRTVRTLTSQGRLAQMILSVLPCASLLLLTVTNPGYVEPLYETSPGHVVLGLAAVLVVTGAFVIQRIVTIKL